MIEHVMKSNRLYTHCLMSFYFPEQFSPQPATLPGSSDQTFLKSNAFEVKYLTKS